jgi:hypothetical protein
MASPAVRHHTRKSLARDRALEGTRSRVRDSPLDPDAQGVLISVSGDRATRRSSSGRRPARNGSEFFDVSVYQIRASTKESARPSTQLGPTPQPVMESKELTILTPWAKALADGLSVAHERARAAKCRRAAPGSPGSVRGPAVSFPYHDVTRRETSAMTAAAAGVHKLMDHAELAQ